MERAKKMFRQASSWFARAVCLGGNPRTDALWAVGHLVFVRERWSV